MHARKPCDTTRSAEGKKGAQDFASKLEAGGLCMSDARGYSDEHKKDDLKALHSMGYAQELDRRMGLFSNFAISFSIICILSGGINSLARRGRPAPAAPRSASAGPSGA